MKRRLITSALPYVNNIPHLGNLIQVLSADVFARYCRASGYETLYICGTDEYGTATETKAAEEGIHPKELCDRYYEIHSAIYKWFDIQFDIFGRTSTAEHTQITQAIFKDLYGAGLIKIESSQQLYCEKDQRFLADRYIRGQCPHCKDPGARGDQCEHCNTLLEPTDLINPTCTSCNTTPTLRSTSHLYLDLPALSHDLANWIQKASTEGSWSYNARRSTQAWLRDGLKLRAITRDLQWGIPVPLSGFANKVFYVWFDAPIGYISITACLGKEKNFDWKSWWQNPSKVELFQFVGKDNIPFHTVIFPSSLIGASKLGNSESEWTMLHHISATEYLNYEGGKFSKSKNLGIFGNNVQESNIDADIWRFYLMYNRPEKSDTSFSWSDFKERVNAELIGNLGNFVNRTCTFIAEYCSNKIPEFPNIIPLPILELRSIYTQMFTKIISHLEQVELRDAFRTIFMISDTGNKWFQKMEPWKLKNTDPYLTSLLLAELAYLLLDIAILLWPFLPKTALSLSRFLNQDFGTTPPQFSNLGKRSGVHTLGIFSVLFKKLEDNEIQLLKARYSGAYTNTVVNDVGTGNPDKNFDAIRETITTLPVAAKTPCHSLHLDLRVAKILAVEPHPNADKLYIEIVDDGTSQNRVIVSGLVAYYTKEELLGKCIVLVSNLKPAKLRGVESQGMLLAARNSNPVIRKNGTSRELEVLELPGVQPGTRILLKNQDETKDSKPITIDEFLQLDLHVHNYMFMLGDSYFIANGQKILLQTIQEGKVG